MVLVITGSPGVGKHTIANEVLHSNDYELLDINKIANEKNFIEYNQDVGEVDVDKFKKSFEEVVTEKSLIVGHLAPYVLSSKNVKLAIVLRKNPYKLLEIYKKRKYTEEKRRDNLGSEILGIITNDTINNFGQEKTFQIDVSESTPKAIVSRIDNIINRNDAGDNIDWLPLIQEKNDFKTFFEY